MDTYRNYFELAHQELEGADYQIHLVDRQTSLAVIAPHGGGIEPGTLEIARALAGDRFSFYAFEGLKKDSNGSLHITSTHFDESRGVDLAQRVDRLIAVHGCGGEDGMISVGGLDEVWKERLIAALRASGYLAREDTGNRAGNHPKNLCNRCRSGKGLQIEIDEAMRSKLFRGLKREQRRYPTPVFSHLVETLKSALPD